jgi:hypothetical protein
MMLTVITARIQQLLPSTLPVRILAGTPVILTGFRYSLQPPLTNSELVSQLLHDHFQVISLPITENHAALQTALCRGAKIPLARSPGRLNCVRWRLIFVGLQHGTLLAPRILRWLLDFSKVRGILAQCVNHK